MTEKNQESILDIVSEMRKRAEEVYAGQDGYPESWKDQMDYGEIYELADRIEAAHKREHEAIIEKSSINGNNASIREVLEKFNAVDLSVLEFPLDGDSSTIYNSNKKEITIPYWRVAELLNEVKAAQDMAKAALSAPPRNCDRPECATTKAAQDTWRKEDGGKTAYYEWLLATSTEGDKK